MRAYFAVFSVRFRTLLQYRAAAWAGFATQTFWGLIRSMIFLGFYHAVSGPQPLDLRQVITYVWLGQALFALLPWSLDKDVAALIRTGNIAYELVRPVNLYKLWFFRALAMRTAPVLLRATPMVALAAVIFPLLGAKTLSLAPPAGAAAAAAFALSLLASLLLSCVITVFMSISLIYTISGEGVANLMPAAIWSLSGIVIPLPFLPDWMQPILKLLPFRGLMDVPFQIYIGKIQFTQAAIEIFIQLVWASALILIGYWLFAKGLKRVAVQGG